MEEKDKKQKTNWFVVVAVIFALFALVLIANIVYVATTSSQGTASIANTEEILDADDGAYKLEIENERTEAQVTERHWIYGTTEHVPNQNGGTVANSTETGYVTDEYETNPSNEVKKNYHYVEVSVTEEENDNSDMATVDQSSGNVKGELKPTETYVDYYYSINEPEVETTISKNGLVSDGTKVVTEEDQSITYTISYEASVDDYIGNGTITIVDTLPYEISEGSYKVTIDSEEIECDPTYDSESKTLTWVIDEVAIDTYGENDTTSPQTIKVEIELTVVYADVNYGAESLTNEVSGKIVLEDFPENPYEAEPDDETIDLNITVEVNAIKTWIDYSNSYDTRPGTITVNVMRYTNLQNEEQAEVVDAREITIENENTFDITFEDLPKYDENGNEYIYYITEDEVQGYTTEIDEDFNIVNTIEQELTEIAVSKVWKTDDDANDLTATINLYRDGVLYDTATITGNSSYTFEDLPVYAISDDRDDRTVTPPTNYDGHKYTYTLEEGNVPGYVTTFDEETNTFTNTMEATGDYTVTKVWVDGENAYNTRPGSIDVTVFANGVQTIYTATLNEGNSWEYTFRDIELYDDEGHAIVYTAIEDVVPTGYDVSYAATENGYKITNTISQEQIEISGTKTWIEPEGSTRKYAVFQLYQNGIPVEGEYVTEQDDGTYSFKGLDKYDLTTGLEWEYTIQESYVDGYTTTVDDTGLNFTNTINEGSTYVYGTKTWITPVEDKNTLTATIILYQDGNYYTETTVTGDERYLFSELPQYSQTDGHEYVYTVAEVSVEGYTTTDDENGNFTNTINQEYINISGTKTWDTTENPDNLTATIYLYRNGTFLYATTVTGNNSYQFTGLEKYNLETGEEYVYTVDEAEINNYEKAQDGYNFTNTIMQEYLDLSGEKVWIGPDDPSEHTATIGLYQDDVLLDTTTVTGNDTYTFENLEKYNLDTNPKSEYVYTVKEIDVEGYTSEQDGYNFVNTVEQKMISVEGQKTWITPEDKNSLEATFYLYRDGVKVDNIVGQVTGDGTYGFYNLPMYDLTDGHEYVYTVEEANINGYITTQDGYNFTNTIEQEYISLSGTKEWITPEDKDTLSTVITLYRDGSEEIYKAVEITGNGSYEFTDLPRYDVDGDGHEYVYTVKESSVHGYTSTDDGKGNFVNTIAQEKVSLEGTKTWITPADKDSLTADITLLRDGSEVAITTVTGDGSYKFEDLDKYDLTDGHIYEYTVDEVKVDGYTTVQSGNNFVNTINQEYITITGSKHWATDNDSSSLEATFYLYRDDEVVPCQTVTVIGNTAYTFTDIEKYDLTDGHEYTYRVEEGYVPGYTTTDDGNGNFTNTISEKENIEVVKEWVDNNNAYNTRPNSIEVTLYANDVETEFSDTLSSDNDWKVTFTDLDAYDDNGHAITYTVQEGSVEGYDTEIFGTGSGYRIVNTIKQETLTIKGEKTWITPEDLGSLHATVELYRDGVLIDTDYVTGDASYTFFNLDKYDLTDGHEYEYTVKEVAVDGYTTTYDDYDIINTINQATTSVTVSKTWVNSSDDSSSHSATIILYQDGTEIDRTTITGNGLYTFDNLDKYDLGDGHIYEYTTEEEEVSGYITTQDGNTFVNTIEEEYLEITGRKTWVTPDDPDDLVARFILYQDGVEYDTDVVYGNGYYLFTNLPKYELSTGHIYNYTVGEEKVDGYTTTDDGNGNFTNTIAQEKIILTAYKTWITPENVNDLTATIYLYQDGKLVDLGEIKGNGSYVFTNLDKYNLETGEEYVYTVEEASISGYTTDQIGTSFINTIEQEHVSMYGSKHWITDEDVNTLTTTIELLRDGDVIDSVEITGNKGYEFAELPKYDLEDGHIYEYTVNEISVDGYTTTDDGNGNYTNTIEQDYLSVSGTKTWVTPADPDTLSATIELYRDGQYYTAIAVVGNDTYTFEDLEKYDLTDGHVYDYEVKEVTADGYTSVQSGNDFVNTIAQEKTTLTVDKTWITPNDPNTLTATIELLRDGIKVDEGTITGNSSYTFADLDKYDLTDGHEYEYTSQEVLVKGYDTVKNENSYVNTIEQAYTSVTGTKIWETEDNKSDLTATINLYRDDEIVPIDTVTVTGDGSYKFENLEKYDLTDGHEYSYYVEEELVAGYETTEDEDGNFVNTKVDTTDITVTKEWIDNNNSYGLRSNIVEVTLFENGTSTGKFINLSDANEWTATFEGLDAYDENGKAITYTVEESEVSGYDSEIIGTSDGYRIVNTIAQESLTITGNKTWITPEDYGSFEVTIELLRDGVVFDTETIKGDASYTFYNLDKYDLTDGHEYAYTVNEVQKEGYTSVVNGYDITNTIEQDYIDIVGSKTWISPDDINTLTTTIELYRDDEKIDSVDITGNQPYSFTHLEKYDLTDGHIYEYEVREASISGYTTDQDGYSFTNTVAQEYTSIVGNKVWISSEDVSTLTATIELYRDGVLYETVDVTGDNLYKFEDLEVYDLTDGHKYEYEVKEADIDGYVQTQDENNFTNTIEQEMLSIEGSKTWISPDSPNEHSVTIELYRDGDKYDEVTVTGDQDFAFDDLPKYDLTNGHVYNYTLSEVTVPGYTTEHDGYNYTNTIEQEKISISGTKTWITPEDKDKLLAAITLYRDGVEVTTSVIDGDNTYTFNNLDRYDLTDGHEYVYTVAEAEVKGYTTVQDGYDFTNTIEQAYTELTVSKEWITPNDVNGLKAEIELLRDGKRVDSHYITGNDTYTFTDLPMYDLTDGHVYEYTSREVDVYGYTVEQTDNDFVNTIAQDYVDVNVTKEWNDVDNYYLTRPDDITVNLLRDDEVVDTAKVTVEDNWQYTFEHLDMYDLTDGHIYEYTITEDDVYGYITSINGYEITNTYVGTDDIEVEEELQKIADTPVITEEDEHVEYDIVYDFTINNYAGKLEIEVVDILPAEINVKESDLGGGEYHVTQDSEGNLVYTITWEEEVEVLATGYTGHIEEHVSLVYVDEDVTHDLENEAVVTLRTFYAPTDPDHPNEPREEIEDEEEADVEQVYKVEVPVVKVWDDSDNAKGHRPSSVVVDLLADGERARDYDGDKLDPVVLSDENNWSYTFTNLPKYDSEGNHIEYTVTEKETRDGDLEYYEEPEITYGDEYVQITNSYQMKETELDSEITKTATELITSANDEVTYEITYNATIEEYIGEAYLRVTDTLPYGIDLNYSDLAGGEYDSNTHEITWHVDLGHINTNENGPYEVNFEKTITVVYGDRLELPLTSMTNTVEGKLYLTENETVNTVEDEAETEVQIPGKVIVKYVDIDTGEEIAEEVDIDGWAGDPYITDLLDIDHYDFVEATPNTEGNMIEGVIEVIYYYKKAPGRVIVNHYDIDTGEKLTDEIIIDGFVGEDYITEQGDFDYYEFVESTDNTSGEFTREDIYVDYYYRKLTFNLSVDKVVSSITKNGETSEMNSSLEKVEVGRKEANSTTISVTYKITVTNTNEIAGTTTVVDYLPDYFVVSGSNPSYWIDRGNSLALDITLEPGESVDLTVVLDWIGGNESFGSTTNSVVLFDVNNPAGFDELDTSDNQSSAKVLLSVRTGWDNVKTISPYILLALCAATLIVMGVRKNQTKEETAEETEDNDDNTNA